MKFGIIFVLLSGILLVAFLITKPNKEEAVTNAPADVSPTISTVRGFTATFEVYTNGTKRIFTDTKYHNQHEDVFITAPDPSIIYLKKEGLTWQDFFNTLPMQLTKDCLVTGTKQTFCSNETQKLKFTINGIEDTDALVRTIKQDDSLKVMYQ